MTVGLALWSLSAATGQLKEKAYWPSNEERPDSYWLEKAGLKLGMSLPPITAVDEHGDPFELRKLHGRYSVLIFGCLT